MKSLNRQELDFGAALAYFQYSLKETNMLSSTLIKLVNFKLGSFFTLLPDNADLKKINEFRCGGIAIGVRDQAPSLILNKLQLNDKLSCIFDDVTATFTPEYKDLLFHSFGLFNEKEVYYLITSKTVSEKLVEQCLQVSNAVWHSLCVLTKTDFTDVVDKKLSLEKIKDICMHADLIMVGAYDGEGYIFWEKQN